MTMRNVKKAFFILLQILKTLKYPCSVTIKVIILDFLDKKVMATKLIKIRPLVFQMYVKVIKTKILTY